MLIIKVHSQFISLTIGEVFLLAFFANMIASKKGEKNEKNQ